MASGDVNQNVRVYTGASVSADATTSVVRLGARRSASLQVVWTTSNWVGDIIVQGSNSPHDVNDANANWETAALNPGISRAVYSVSGASGAFTFTPPHGWNYNRLRVFFDRGSGTLTTATVDLTSKDN